MIRSGWTAVSVLALSLCFTPSVTHADPGNAYCVTPAFVSGNIPPNLLLMIDNSASMYDLAFVDKGKKHCSIATAKSCFVDADCAAGEGTCSVFDRQPYYCYDQTYSNSNTYTGYFSTKDSSNNDIYYAYDSGADGFAVAASFPGDCGTHSGTVKKDSANNTVCVEYDNTSRNLLSFVAKGNYLNWLSTSKFDVEKQILTGGKLVTKVCTADPNRACTVDGDCAGLTPNTCGSAGPFLMPESRGCVGRGFVKDAISANFVNYASPPTNNTNSQLGVTFSVRGPQSVSAQVALSPGGQTYIDLFATPAKIYDYGACQKAVDTLTNTSSTNAAVKQDVAACLAGASSGYCSGNANVGCFSTFPDCYVPGYCSGTTTPCTTNANCTSPSTCVFGYFCEGVNGQTTAISCSTPGITLSRCTGTTTVCTSNAQCTSPKTCDPECPAAKLLCDEVVACSANSDCPSGETCVSGYCAPAKPSITCSTAGSTAGCYTPPTYWCDFSTPTYNAVTCSGPTDTTTCYSSNNQNGKCAGSNAACQGTLADPGHDLKCPGDHVCLGWISQGSHSCVVRTPAVNHGTCNMISGATNGVCGGQLDYGTCTFGTTDTLTKSKVSFQQSMQACWQYNRFVNHVSGGADIGIDDIKTVDKQCSDIYNGSGSNPAYRTCSNNHDVICTDANAATVCGAGNSCSSGPSAIGPGYPALICGGSYMGQVYYKSGSTWYREGSLNDKTTTMSGILLPSGVTPSRPTQCAATDLLFDCMKNIYKSFCSFNSAPGVTDPSDGPSDTSSYDNLPAIISGVAVESQLGAPIKSMRARVAVTTPACTKDGDCGTGKSCSAGVCKPAGLIQQFGGQMRIGAMDFNPYGVGNTIESVLAGLKNMTRVCSNNTSQVCTVDAECPGGTCKDTVPVGDTSSTSTYKNYDGGRIIYPIGKGKCASMTTTPCSSDSDCSLATCLNGYCGTKGTSDCTTALTCTETSPACIRDAAGDHNAQFSLVNTIDGIRANAWTPFAETFYNALGYFAAVPSGTAFLSRTDLRLNALRTTSKVFTSFDASPVDFNEALQPSEYRCQQNYILLVTDGSSTADRNDTVNRLATTYSGQANAAAGSCTVTAPAVDYGGSSNLPVLSWIGNHQNLASFATGAVTALYCPDKTTACSAAGVCPTTNDRSCASYHCSVSTGTSCGGGSPAANYGCPAGEVCTRNPRDYVTTYVVFNGADNGANGVCDAYTLLDKTAKNGGTTLKQATDPASLTTALTSIFENIAAKASSGTAASILSNSEGSGANILQAVFYPKKIFSSQTSSNWIGEMQNLWYYVDPMINHSTIREDSNGDRKLNLLQDNVVSLRFDNTDNTTYAYMSTDTNGDGIGDTPETKQDPDVVNSVWRAGRQLWQRNLSTAPRTIYTTLLPTGTETMYGADSSVHSGLMKFNYGTTTVADGASFPLATALAAGMSPAPNNEPALRSYLQMADSAGGVKLMKYVHGFDFPGDAAMRSRTVQTTTIKTDAVAAGVVYPDASLTSSAFTTNPASYGLGVWKLGDIISSTPRIQANGRLNSYGLPAPGGYSDPSYNSFIGSSEYRGRGMVYVGANDGMLHAFKLGLLDVTASGYQKATLSGSGLGEEQWAFIPKQALPYLKYYSDPAYNHIYYVDGTTVIADASIGIPDGCTGAYYTCAKSPSVVDPSSNALDPAKNTWRTVLIGGAGLGGASAKSCASGSNCVPTPTTDPADGTGATGLGFSSYYALDITDPNHPKLLWEFSNPALGYATSGPAIVRVGDRDKNGRWFALFGSGPTGKIDTENHQFMGRSDQSLKFFAVDLATGVATQLNDTYHIDNAFSGSLVGGAIDADRWNPNVTGNYKDDAILVGYTAKPSGGTDWTSGGVLRITTKESTNPGDWVVSPILANVGPVTTAISRLQDRKNRALWLYFGTGRYYSRSGNVIDDYATRRAIFGIKDPCYNYRLNPGNLYDKTCTDAVSSSDIANQSSRINTVGAGGWQIDLDASTDNYGAERVVTDAVALTNGTVFITSFEPTSDVCGFGGNSYLWAVAYNTGDRPSDAALAGKALIQLSTGEFKEVDLSQAFGSDSARMFRRTNIPMTGKPPADAFPVVSKSANKPVKKIMHIQER